MLNLKKEADTLKVGDIELGSCPVCKSYVSHLYFMQDALTKKQSKWYSCQCGVVWQTAKPTKIYDKKYFDAHIESGDKLKDCFEYPVRIYAPLIEELIYGRKVLLIGKTTSYQEEALQKRGWVATSIDKNEYATPQILADFEDHDFGESKFNMIWLDHILECFNDPLKALEKITSLLTEDGIMFLSSPDTDFIHTRGSGGFRHWKPETNFLMWNREALTKYLDKLGFVVIMARQNCWQRFVETDDFHLIAQKKFF